MMEGTSKETNHDARDRRLRETDQACAKKTPQKAPSRTRLLCGSGRLPRHPGRSASGNDVHTSSLACTSDSGNDQTKRKRWGYKRIEELLKKPEQEVLLVMNNATHGFQDLLEENLSKKPDWIALILAALVRGLNCTSLPEGFAHLLNVLTSSQFFVQHLPLYISSMPLEGVPAKQRKFKKPLQDAIRLFKLYIDKMPTNIQCTLPSIAALQFVVQSMKGNQTVIDESVTLALEELGKMRDTVIEDNKKNIRRVKEDPESEDSKPPPNDFRQMSVMPQKDDVLRASRPFLRRNKTEGAYKDLHHYLDVQFRLLREDMIAPLRESVAEYTQKRHDEYGARTVKNMRLYRGVKILHPLCGNESVIYRIQFDNSMMKNTAWEHSKRLIYGSLVCLSKDNFKSIEFAIVANRDNERIRNGMLDIQFCSEDPQPWIERRNVTYIMAESTSYFEAYRHVLKGLQEISAHSLPFQSYLVQSKATMKVPEYLRIADDPVFNLECVIKKEDSQVDAYSDSDADSVDFDEIEDTQYLMERKPANQNRFAILEETQWPSAAELGLDNSQHAALRTALTQEFALIQGPPGTGKTFLGLKIMEILLANKAVWNKYDPSNELPSPILVVCYTNHALDQFLEGVSKFEDSRVVRVGGRSKSALLERYNLRSWRQTFREKRLMGKQIHEARLDASRAVERIQSNIERSLIDLELCDKGILSFSDLVNVMDAEHACEFISGMPPEMTKTAQNQVTSLATWLAFDKACEEIDLGTEDTDGNEANVNSVTVEDEVVAMTELRMLDDDMNHHDAEAERRKRLNYKAATAELDVVLDTSFPKEYLTKSQTQTRVQNLDMFTKLSDMLKHCAPMSEEEASQIKDVWQLDVASRWKLYKFWVSLYKQHILSKIHDCEEAYAAASRRKKEVLLQEDLCVMQSATVVGMTTTGAAKYRSLLPQLNPKIIIVEEAAEVLEAHIITTLTPSCQHLIMIGDHQQLRPNPAVFDLAENFKLKVSLFERMVMNGMSYVTLQHQHRMRPEIANFIRLIYPDLKDADEVKEYANVRGIDGNIKFIDHSVEEDQCEENQSKSNYHEASYVVKLCLYLLHQGYLPSQVTILTPYTGQLLKIRKQMPKAVFDGVRVCAVDNFQGEENDFILLSLVRSNSEKKIGFLNDSNRMCVALSRAKRGMFIIGNLRTLAEKNEHWEKVISTAQSDGMFAKSLALRCRNHPAMSIKASTPNDFEKAPEGGCVKLCQARLKCGHVCDRVCHAYDVSHNDYRCIKPCERKLCANNHPCSKLCYEECGSCRVVTRVQLQCGHYQDLPCNVAPFLAVCKHVCTHRLQCRHMCQNLCGEPHTTECQKPVKSKLSCGHTINLKCFEKPRQSMCKDSCNATLLCGHPCSGTCGECFAGRIHRPCTAVCGRTLVCGHQCEAPCTKNCPPCTKPCENRCIHSKCTKLCGERCIPCNELCEWACFHSKCTRKCSEPCNRGPCNLPCTEILPCGHQCIGVCGEKCPSKCRRCDKEEVEEIFFGTEEDEDATFAELIDCGHIFETSGLDQWMETSAATDGSSQHIQLKACPRCKTTIRRNLRYGKSINAVLGSIELVKNKIQGDVGVLQNESQILIQQLTKMTSLYARHEKMHVLDKKIADRIVDNFRSYPLGVGVVAALGNIINIIERVLKLKQKLQELAAKNPLDKELSTTIGRFSRDILRWSCQLHERISEQEYIDTDAEISRIRLLINWCALKQNQTRRDFSPSQNLKTKQEKCIVVLSKFAQFTESDETFVQETFEEWEKACPVSAFCLSEKEKKEIFSAIGLSTGHWYKCPKGHVYVIADCGGAVVEGTCPDCQSIIGGTGHRMAAGNQIATEMGSTRPAWPTGLM